MADHQPTAPTEDLPEPSQEERHCTDQAFVTGIAAGIMVTLTEHTTIPTLVIAVAIAIFGTICANQSDDARRDIAQRMRAREQKHAAYCLSMSLSSTIVVIPLLVIIISPVQK